MEEIKILIDFQKYSSHDQLIDDLSPVFASSPNYSVYLRILLRSDSNFLYSDFLMILVSAVSYLRGRGNKVTGNIVFNSNDNRIQYASGINFFSLLGLEYEEKGIPKSVKGKFIEITPYNRNNIAEIFTNIRKILISNIEVNLEVQQLLDYCMYEIMDNVLNHSAFPDFGNGNGWCCSQLFPGSDEIRLLICDSGVGIHKSLTSHPKSKYKELNEKEALEMCTEKGITNSEGMGFGLYATSEFIKHNGGEMMIYSGNHYSKILNGQKSVHGGSYWQGTFVYLKINIKKPVDYHLIMPKGHSLPDDYQFFLEQTFGFNEDLW